MYILKERGGSFDIGVRVKFLPSYVEKVPPGTIDPDQVYTINRLGATIFSVEEIEKKFFPITEVEMYKETPKLEVNYSTEEVRTFIHMIQVFKADKKISAYTAGDISHVDKNVVYFQNGRTANIEDCKVLYKNKKLVNGQVSMTSYHLLADYEDGDGNLSFYDPRTDQQNTIPVAEIGRGVIELIQLRPHSSKTGRARYKFKGTNVVCELPGGRIFIEKFKKPKRQLTIGDNIFSKSHNLTGTVKEVLPTSGGKYYRICLDSGKEYTTSRKEVKLIK